MPVLLAERHGHVVVLFERAKKGMKQGGRQATGVTGMGCGESGTGKTGVLPNPRRACVCAKKRDTKKEIADAEYTKQTPREAAFPDPGKEKKFKCTPISESLNASMNEKKIFDG